MSGKKNGCVSFKINRSIISSATCSFKTYRTGEAVCQRHEWSMMVLHRQSAEKSLSDQHTLDNINENRALD